MLCLKINQGKIIDISEFSTKEKIMCFTSEFGRIFPFVQIFHSNGFEISPKLTQLAWFPFDEIGAQHIRRDAFYCVQHLLIEKCQP